MFVPEKSDDIFLVAAEKTETENQTQPNTYCLDTIDE